MEEPDGKFMCLDSFLNVLMLTLSSQILTKSVKSTENINNRQNVENDKLTCVSLPRPAGFASVATRITVNSKKTILVASMTKPYRKIS